jgi:signal transduction histidine kinase
MATASHELQTPVAALRGFLQLAARRLAEGDQAGTTTYVERSLNETRRLGELVGRLLDVALVQHGRVALRPESIDLASTVREVLDVARMLSPQVRFRVVSAPRSLRLTADALRMQQVILNLVMNAATHGSRDGGEITLDLRRADGEAVVEVADHGPGIPDAVTEQMFVPFVASGTEHPGLGLGLFLAHEIVTAHGGSVDVASRDGEGTVVRVRLPVGASKGPRR